MPTTEETVTRPEEQTKRPVQYALLRRDLRPLERWVIDVGHATAEAIRVAPIDKRTILRVLHVANEPELRNYHKRLLAKGFHVALVEEPDEPYCGAAMALATEPLTERVSALSKLFFHLERMRFT